MARCIIILPWNGEDVDYPGIDPVTIQGRTLISFSPPPDGAAPYILVRLKADAASIITLSNQPNCLLVCNILDDDSLETAELTPQSRNTIRAKISDMGFKGAQYGLLNAAIQASQNRDELSLAIATKAFYRDKFGNKMTEVNLRGSFI